MIARAAEIVREYTETRVTLRGLFYQPELLRNAVFAYSGLSDRTAPD